MKAVLRTALPVRCTAVFAEMAWMQRRPELGMLCREALAQGGHLDRTTVSRVLPGVTDVGAQNLVQSCAVLGLCDRAGTLTALASEVAASDEAPVPEQGVFALWWVAHPLFGARVLGARRLAADLGPRTQDVPALALPDVRGRVFASAIDPTERFVVRGLPHTGALAYGVARETRARCELRWTLDFAAKTDAWELVGTMEDPSAKDSAALATMRSTPVSAGVDFAAILSHWAAGPLTTLGRWNPATQRLAVTFDGLTDDEREVFRVRRALDNVSVPGRGDFARLEFSELPVEPRATGDAQRWAERRLARWFDGNPGFWRRSDVIRAFRSLVDETPLADFAPEVPAHDALLADAARTPARFWSLAAPVDLALHAVPHTLLSANGVL